VWKDDAAVMAAMEKWIVNQKNDLNDLLTEMFKHNDGSPYFQFLQIYGKFVFKFSELTHSNTEVDAFDLTTAWIIDDPQVQALTAQMVGDKIDKGLKLNE
jgi:hypothetical protein